MGLLFCCACSPQQKQPSISLFVAASLTEAIQEIGSDFQIQQGIRIYYNFASSGALAQQILASPRADLFISANPAWMQTVIANARNSEQATLLSNQLVLIAHKDSQLDLAAFRNGDFQFLAIGDPAHVPLGQYTKTWLESQQLWEGLANKLVPAVDARAVLTLAESKRATFAVVYRSDYILHKDKLRMVLEVPLQQGPHIAYPVALLNRSNPEAQAFFKYLQREEATQVFEKYGFVRLQK